MFHASTTDGCGNCEVVTADSGECCEHIAIEYNLRNAQIVLPAPVLVAYVCAAAFETANMLPRSADSVQPPAHAPPGLGSSPPELGAAPLPLRI